MNVRKWAWVPLLFVIWAACALLGDASAISAVMQAVAVTTTAVLFVFVAPQAVRRIRS